MHVVVINKIYQTNNMHDVYAVG